VSFCCASCPRAGFRYRIVDAKSLCPSQDCTVRRSTPACNCIVANVARNLCRNQRSHSAAFVARQEPHCPQLSPARRARRLSACSILLFGLPFLVGKTNAALRLRFLCSSRHCASLGSNGISRSSQLFGRKPRDGLRPGHTYVRMRTGWIRFCARLCPFSKSLPNSRLIGFDSRDGLPGPLARAVPTAGPGFSRLRPKESLLRHQSQTQ
jgi:hypothetical protein